MPSDQNNFTFTQANGVDDLVLLNASMTDFSYGVHAHEEFSFGVTLSGRQDFFSLGEYHKSYPGQIMLINPDDAHDGHSGTDDPLTYTMLYVHPDQLTPYLEGLGVAQPENFRLKNTLADNTAIREKILRLAALINLQQSPTAEYESVLFELAEELVTFQSKPRVTPQRHHMLLERAKEYIHDNYTQELSLDQVCQVACMSKYHFLRRFKDYTGMTPHQYWLNHRINRARQALRAGVAVSDIANTLGFNDLSHFNRRFKPVFGMTPKRYQQLILR